MRKFLTILTIWIARLIPIGHANRPTHRNSNTSDRNGVEQFGKASQYTRTACSCRPTLALFFLSLLVAVSMSVGDMRIFPRVIDTNMVSLTFDCETDAYYQIMAAGSLKSNEWVIPCMGLGSLFQVSWTSSFPQTVRYFRVRAIPQAAPRDEDGDGVDDVFELSHSGFDPLDYYNGIMPDLNIISGNNQTGYLGKLLTQPLLVRISTNGIGLNNAPVTFTATQGTGQIAESTNDPFSSCLAIRADATGQAAAFLCLSSNPGTNVVTVSVTSGGATNAVQFTATGERETIPDTGGWVKLVVYTPMEN